MQTTIGSALTESSVDRVGAAVFGAMVVGGDLSVVAWIRYPLLTEARWAIVTAALILQMLLVRGDVASAGIDYKPLQGWVYWLRMTVVLALSLLAVLIVAAWGWILAGKQLPVHTTAPAAFGARFLQMCVFSPLQEESVLVLCASFVKLLRPTGTILLSGVAFGALHILYGNPSPENLVGGVFLGWSFLKSGTIVVPMILHSLGNFAVLLVQLAGWFLVH